jgi:hypothetical protein
MATLSPSWTQVHPSFVEPDILLQYNQASGATDVLAGEAPRVKIGSEDLYVYLRRLEVRTRVAVGQTAYNQLPGVSVVPSMITLPTYLQRVRAEYDHHDTANASHWGFSIVEAQRLAMQQGHFQYLRNNLLYGTQPQNGEGLLNTVGITNVLLPADPNGQTTFTNYDNGAMAVFFLTQFSSLKTRTMQFGISHRFCILGPQRILGGMQVQNIVQLVQYQRPGSGTATTMGLIDNVMKDIDDNITWSFDDTLIGKGQGGSDAVLMVMPEVKKPAGRRFNTNVFATLAPGLDATTLQYTDMAAPVEIPTPLAGGAIDVLSEWRTTPGWLVRPEAATVLSIPYP